MGAHPLLIPNVRGRSQSLGGTSTEMEAGLKDLLIPIWVGAHPMVRPHPRSVADPALWLVL